MAGDLYFDNVVLLLPFDGTNGSTSFLDQSFSRKSLTPGGNSQLDTSQKKFGTASLKQDGSGDVVTINDSNDFHLGTSNFTIEAHIRPASVSGTQFLFGQWNTSGNLGWILYLSGSNLSLNVSTTGSDNINDLLGGSLSINTWYHVCVDFDGTTYRMYVDGVMVDSSTTLRSIFNSPNNLSIGSNAPGTSFNYNGYMDELRITKGVARYASDGGFTPPAAAYPLYPEVDANFSSVVLLPNFDGVDGATTATDDSSSHKTLTFVGNAQIDDSVLTPWGDAALLLDGTGDYVTAPDGTDFDLGSGSWTIEALGVRWTSDPSALQHIIGQWRSTGNLRSWLLAYNSVTNQLQLSLSSDGSTPTDKISVSFSPTLGTWYSIAASFDGTTYRLFVDGLSVGTATTLVALFNSSAAFSIGAQDNGTSPFDGRIAEVRITKGVARYTANYRQSPVAFPRPSSDGITSITPNTGSTAGGTPITIAGAGFTSATGVTIDGNAATSFTVVSDIEITCTTPSGTAGAKDVVVQRPTTDLTSVGGFTYVSIPAPTFTSITPTLGGTGDTFEIVGDNLTGTTDVTFDGVAATSIVVVDDEHVTGVLPSHATGLVDLYLETPGGSFTEPDAFEYVINIRVTQVPLLVLDLTNQPVRVTQVPVLVLALPVQPVRVTQVPFLVTTQAKPLPVPAPIVPEVPVTEFWQWYTVVNITEIGKEQRSAIRANPRINMNFNALMLNDADRRDVYQMFVDYIDKSFSYPMYQYSTKLNAAALAGDTKLYFDPAATDMRDGEVISLFDPQLVVTTLATILTVDADGATLTAPLTADAGAHWYVAPAPTFHTKPTIGFQMRSIDGDFSLQLEGSQQREVLRPDQSSGLLTIVDGMLLLDKRPLANDDVNEQFSQDTTWLDNGINEPAPRTVWPVPYINGDREYLAHRPAGLDYWRAVGNNLKGRQKAFLLPTFRDDLPLSEQPALSATIIKSSNISFFAYWRSNAYRYVRIQSQAGVIVRKILEVTANYDPVTGDPLTINIELSSSIGAGAGANIISMVSFVNTCRLDSDVITLLHEPVDTIVSIKIRTIEE